EGAEPVLDHAGIDLRLPGDVERVAGVAVVLLVVELEVDLARAEGVDRVAELRPLLVAVPSGLGEVDREPFGEVHVEAVLVLVPREAAAPRAAGGVAFGPAPVAVEVAVDGEVHVAA